MSSAKDKLARFTIGEMLAVLPPSSFDCFLPYVQFRNLRVLNDYAKGLSHPAIARKYNLSNASHSHLILGKFLNYNLPAYKRLVTAQRRKAQEETARGRKNNRAA